MADILRVTSAAVDSLLSASSSSTSVTNQSFNRRLKVSGKHVKEISLKEVLRRSQDEGINLAEFLNNQPANSSANELPFNIEHRTVTPSKSVLVGNFVDDESRHLVAPSADSSEYISIIDVGKSLSTTNSLSLSSKESSHLKKSDSDVSVDDTLRDTVDLIPVKESSGRKDTSAATSNVSSLKTAEVVDASTPNSARQKEITIDEPEVSSIHSDHSVGRLKTPDMSDQPPALPPLHLPQRGLKQGSLGSVESTKEQPVPDMEVKSLSSARSSTARQMLQGTNGPTKRGAVAVQRINPPPASAPVTDQTSQIAAAVAAAVAATTPYYQLKAEMEMKLEQLTAELQRQNAPKISKSNSKDAVEVAAPSDEANDSLDITVVPENDEKDDIGLPTPIHPRVAPKPRSHRKPRERSGKQGSHSSNDEPDNKRVTAESLRSQFEESADETQQSVPNPRFMNRTNEYELMRKDLVNLLNEARNAKKEIEDMRHTERMQGLRTTVRSEAPADVYLERIREREDKLFKPRYSASEREYKTPAYILQAKDTLHEIEEKRSSVERKGYPLDSTYLCEEQSPEDEKISKRISEILDNIQKEVKSTNPKKTVMKAEPTKLIKRKPKPNTKLAEKKALYNKLRSENQYHNIQANIGRLKEEEKVMRPEPRAGEDRSGYQSPYKRSGLPQSFPLAPLPRSFPLDPPSIQNQSTPLRTLRQQISTQTSFVARETLNSNQYTKPPTRDVSVYPTPTPKMLDQQCSPLKIPTQDKSQSYTPLPYEEDTTYSYEESERDVDPFMGVVDLPQSVTISGVKRVAPPVDKYSAKLVSDTHPTKTSFHPTTNEDKVTVMQWLEEAILEKLLTDSPEKTAAQDEVSQILGEEVMKEISELGLGLSPDQLHGLMSEIIKEQVEERISHCITEEKPPNQASPEQQKSPGNDSKPTYDESFESSSSSSSSKSSLSPAVTPSFTETEEPSASLSHISEVSYMSPLRSPVFTPPLSPEVVSVSDHTKSPALPEGVPQPAKVMVKKQPPTYFNDTLEQVPLDLTDEVVDPITVFTPDLTSLQQDNTLSLEGTTKRSALGPFTPLNTVQDPALEDSLISQHPLDVTNQSIISQHPLELTALSENIDIPPTVEPEDSSASSTTMSYTETTDHPISAGEILPGMLPREITQQVFTGPLSEGEWPLSPRASDFLQLVKDPEIRELLEQRVNATRSPGYPTFHPQDDTIPEEMVSPLRDEGNLQRSDLQAGPSRTLPPAPRRVSLPTPSPRPRTQSLEHLETLELVTPLPEGDDGRVGSPSPPPFMGLQLEDYEFSGEESVTKSDKSDDSF